MSELFLEVVKIPLQICNQANYQNQLTCSKPGLFVAPVRVWGPRGSCHLALLVIQP